MQDDGSLSAQISSFVAELRASLAFLTRLPPQWIGSDPALRPDFTVASRTFPVAGAMIGAAGGATLIVGWLLGLFPLVSAALAVTATVLVTGALHEDGLADTADSFGGQTREQKFVILDDSRIGTYGAVAVALSLIVRIAGLAAIAPHGALYAALALIGAEAVSRAAMVRMWHDLPAARASGLAAETGPPAYSAMVFALVAAGVVVAVLTLPGIGWRSTMIATILAIAAAFAVIRLIASTLGGRTGDTLGACQQVTAAAFLVGASSF